MTQGIAPWTRRDLTFAPPLTPNDPTTEPALRRDTEALHPPDSAANASPAPGPVLVSALNSAVPVRDARDAITKQRLDSFRHSMTAVYHRPVMGDDLHWDALGDMRVAVPFTMAKHFESQLKTILANQEVVARAATNAHIAPAVLIRVQEGRGTADEIRALTQSLIDTLSERRPDLAWSPVTIRKWMFDCGIGIDCAGYTQQAYLAATGLTRTGAHFADIVNESLSGLEQRGFRKLPAPADVRSGDIVCMSSLEPHEVGHRAIVYDQRVASASDMRALLAFGDKGQAFAVGGPIRVLELDSSWGCGGVPAQGGVRRETVWYNESTGQWAQQRPGFGSANELVPETAPNICHHKLDGFYRGRGG